jgi:hypothetical protein
MMAHGNRMIDWEGLAQQHIAEIQRVAGADPGPRNGGCDGTSGQRHVISATGHYVML